MTRIAIPSAAEEPPALSVIVPTLNERESLPILLRNLALQAGIRFEVIVSDGGSHDGTLQALTDAAGLLPFPVRTISAPCGRARQMNAGAAAAAAPLLLFLHADSLLPAGDSLQRGAATIGGACRASGHQRFAGRFPLRFRRESGEHAEAYAFYEAKAQLARPGCIHGDQGFMLHRNFLEELGSFPTNGPSMLAETMLADRIFTRGQWLLLPGAIETSARRFEMEGLRERQILNALITGAAAAGWNDFFAEIPRLYDQQSRSGRLQLGPVLSAVNRLLDELPPPERRRLWQNIGSFVRDNAWQIPFFLDLRRARTRSRADRSPATPMTRRYDQWLAPLLAGTAGTRLAALLTRVWLWRLGMHENIRGPNP